MFSFFSLFSNILSFIIGQTQIRNKQVIYYYFAGPHQILSLTARFFWEGGREGGGLRGLKVSRIRAKDYIPPPLCRCCVGN